MVEEIGRDQITDHMVAKYRTNQIRSVIHFRRILEANEVQESVESREEFVDKLRNYVLDPDLETRAAFDKFIVDSRRVAKVADATTAFIKAMDAAKLSYASEGRGELIDNLHEVLTYVQDLLSKLEGEDPPDD